VHDFVVPLFSLSLGAERVGPKAANLAALGRAGLPTPGGFCLTAHAYRAQMTALGLDEAVRSFATAELSDERAQAIGSSRMDERHAHLDALIETTRKEIQ